MNCLKDLNTVREEELKLIEKRRERKGHPYYNKHETKMSLIGLALSGGGIRSAATNLGILQGLSERKVLPLVDYISTVSGGGYIGACLSSLLSNNEDVPKLDISEPNNSKLNNSERYNFGDNKKALFGTSWKYFPFRQDTYREKYDNACGIIQLNHIRMRASYLAPRARHFGPDIIRAVGSVFISTLMTLLWFSLIITLITSLYMTIVLLVAPHLDEDSPQTNKVVSQSKSGIGSAGSFSLKAEVVGEKIEKSLTVPNYSKNDLKVITHYAKKPFVKFKNINSFNPLYMGLIIFFVGTVIMFLVSRFKSSCEWVKKEYGWCFLGYIVVLVLTLIIGKIFSQKIDAKEFSEGAILLVPALFAGGALFGTFLAYISISQEEECWSLPRRSQNHKLTGIALIGLLLALILAVLPGLMSIGVGYTNSLLIVIIGSGIRYALASDKGDLEKKGGKFSIPPKYKNWLLDLCTIFFVILVVVYAGNIIRDTLLEGKWPVNDHYSWGWDWRLCILCAGSFIALIIFSRQVDVNKISPHYFYRDRLSETFLQTKLPDMPDECYLRDDTRMELKDLHGNIEKGCAARGPYLLMNATLNLTASKNLKAFNRKSEIFTFSRLFVGSEKIGFQDTDKYKVDGGNLKLARAMTISGAAVSSVMGMNSSLARSFACTIFGVRLGYWLPNLKNPNKAECESVKPKDFSSNFYRLFKELIGYTTDTTEKLEEIYLSDGGHSGDNLGIIPLLQRRVKVLIVSDSECDPNHFFNSFNSSLRNAYVDNGIRIDISLEGLRKDEKGFTKDKFAVGRIYYPEQDEDQKNWIVLFKNTMTGKEVTTIVNYKEKSPNFPHESTGDQFFTEEQLESYRALGRFALYDVFECKDSWLRYCGNSSKNKLYKCAELYDFLTPIYFAR